MYYVKMFRLAINIMIKTYLFIFILMSFTACAQKQDAKKPVKIYPFHPYGNALSDSLTADTSKRYVAYYMLYNFNNTADTNALKQVTTKYIDSIINKNSHHTAFQLEFYVPSNGFDTSFQENKDYLLYDYQDKLLGRFLLNKPRSKYWSFYSNAKPINDDIEILIEDVAPIDSVPNKH